MYLEATARARTGRKARQGTQPQRRKKSAGRFHMEKALIRTVTNLGGRPDF